MIRTRPTRPLPSVPQTVPPRWDRIRALRRAIARGDYETEERWAKTLERILARHPDLA